MTHNQLHHWFAQAYGTYGYRILPICSGKKQPPARDRLELGPRTEDPRIVYDAATSDLMVLDSWYRPDGEFEGYNLGLGLSQSGVVDVSSDCPKWEAEFQRRGLPATFTFRSGSCHGWHHLYRAPEGLFEMRINVSGQYDILYFSYCILPPSVHPSGQRYQPVTDLMPVIYLPPCPDWALAMMKPVQRSGSDRTASIEKSPRVVRTLDTHLDEQRKREPPVTLKGDALKLWRGEKQSERVDGGVRYIRRGVTLWRIAKDLLKAGATVEQAAEALAERDETLEFYKGGNQLQVAMRAEEEVIEEREKLEAMYSAFNKVVS